METDREKLFYFILKLRQDRSRRFSDKKFNRFFVREFERPYLEYIEDGLIDLQTAKRILNNFVNSEHYTLNLKNSLTNEILSMNKGKTVKHYDTLPDLFIKYYQGVTDSYDYEEYGLTRRQYLKSAKNEYYKYHNNPIDTTKEYNIYNKKTRVKKMRKNNKKEEEDYSDLPALVPLKQEEEEDYSDLPALIPLKQEERKTQYDIPPNTINFISKGKYIPELSGKTTREIGDKVEELIEAPKRKTKVYLVKWKENKKNDKERINIGVSSYTIDKLKNLFVDKTDKFLDFIYTTDEYEKRGLRMKDVLTLIKALSNDKNFKISMDFINVKDVLK